LNTGQKTH